METEIFKDIKGYKGIYQISNLGNVKILPRRVKNSIKSFRKLPEKIMKQKTKSNGYKEVNLLNKMFYVHRLVVENFIKTIPKGYSVNHKNGIKDDNRLSNLEILTYSENQKHAFKNGLLKNPVFKGEQHPMSKLSDKIVLSIREDYKIKNKIKPLVDKYKIPRGTLSKIVYRQTWKHL